MIVALYFIHYFVRCVTNSQPGKFDRFHIQNMGVKINGGFFLYFNNNFIMKMSTYVSVLKKRTIHFKTEVLEKINTVY